MAVAIVEEFRIEGSDRSTTNYDRINERLTHDQPAPDGLLIHYAGFDEEDGVFRIVNVWESREQGEAYRDERVLPLVRELVPRASDDPPRETIYELHHVARP